MDTAPAALWQECKDDIRRKIPPQQFNTWIRPVRLIENSESESGSVVTLGVPDDFHKSWLTQEFSETLRELTERIGGPNARLNFEVSPHKPEELVLSDGGSPLVAASAAGTGDTSDAGYAAIDSPRNGHAGNASNGASAPAGPASGRRRRPGAATGPAISVRPEEVPGALPSTLNPRYTLDAFIEADCNRLARSAGVAVAKGPGATSFNPFLIYGKVGLGKTHLAHAIGNEIVRLAPRTQVLYLTSEAFTNCFVQAIQNNTLGDFTKTFRQIDVLIVDDVQFFGGKEKTQEQFFHLFNDLHQRGKQIILCADRSPAEIDGIEERLLSRFRWGLSADVQPPDLETRTAILQRHCSQHGLDLSPDIIDYIAYNVKDNIRCLEGAFNRLLALKEVRRSPIDLPFAREALSDLVHAGPRRSVTAEEIRDIVADYYDIDIDQLIGKSRKRPIVDARQVSMHFCKALTQLSLEAIGSRFGGRDHSTVIHACKAIQARLDTDPGFEKQIEELEKRIQNRVVGR
ncbi:MAG: chromosomal replication initiator protein DnaA [Rhodothermales bacterium]|nr:chromosomal replication initiator protein DnaA [Rhodothermales bacterium]